MRRKNVFSKDVLCLQHFCLFIDHPERLLSTWSGGEPSFINGVKFYAFSSTTSFYLFYFWYYYFYFFFTRIFLEFQNPYRNLSIHVAEGNNILKTNLHFMRVLTTAGTSCLQRLIKMTASHLLFIVHMPRRDPYLENTLILKWYAKKTTKILTNLETLHEKFSPLY